MNIPVPATDPRARPVQLRGASTVAQLLDTAALLLEELGFERLSTNRICAAAGLTPPAIYRYFPNKYAVLKALGERLMASQNAALDQWVTLEFDPDDLPGSYRAMLNGQLAATRREIAGAWIMRALHATPVLAEVRHASHAAVTDMLSAWVAEQWPHIDGDAARRRVRLMVEFGYAVIEMLCERPDPDEAQTVDDAARILAHEHAGMIAPLP
ncbi:TetR/AcrR family transcriptional regulator [Novosphingobium sp.]|uniref:TetR/AcrR family transcriptional regulator n=1 Tax=Novosphingobium sp. TaxID=1874826 RepID=UPI0033411356